MQPKHFLGIFLVFIAGISVALNLFELLPTNPNYNASWFNVFFGLAIAFGGGYLISQKD